MARKRAHNSNGSFVADDPNTPENEAWVEEPAQEKAVDPTRKAKQSRAPKNAEPSAFVFFVSANPENSAFDLRIGDERILGIWDVDRAFVHWRVPRELAELTKLHHHIWSGRVISCEDDD
tara:strand:+ start:11192 stop:11551 length:360 start_codon:yes stop_codon:yes gene_type:complete